MRLWIGLNLPRLPLEVFCPSWSNDRGGVVLEHEKAIALSPAARAGGLVAGMRRGGVAMMMPEAQLFERSPEREADALHAVAMAMLQYTPQVAQGEEDTLLLDVGASLRLFGGVRALCRRIRANLRALGFTAQLSTAPTARGAWLLARHRNARVLGMAALERRLERLPAALLPPARPYQAWLDGIGCTRIGELRRLPRPGLQRRCGKALLDMLDAAHGMAPEMHEWIEAPASFRAHLELFDRIEQADLLMAGAHRLLLQMTGWLCAHQMAVQRIVLQLEHERGKVARAPTALEIVLADPTWREDHLVRLLKERLAKTTLDAPVIGLVLEAPQLQPMEPPSESLFPDPGGSAEDQHKLFELLAARLGPENVLQAAPLADYRPEQANRWLPLHEKARAQMPPDAASLPRPAWLLAKPIALLMRDHRPFYGSPLKIVSNPERIEAGWWGEPQARDYFIAEGLDHAHYWIFRERLGGELKWYLHGLFG
jgi:protein ImuB